MARQLIAIVFFILLPLLTIALKEELKVETKSEQKNTTKLNVKIPQNLTSLREKRHLVTGILRVYVRYGRNLPDRDGWTAGNSDPYVEVKAYDGHGGSIRHTTATHGGNHNPNWNEELYFGSRDWSRFTVQVWDNDGFLTGRDDDLSGVGTYPLHTHTSRYYQRMNTRQHGYIVFDYHFQ